MKLISDNKIYDIKICNNFKSKLIGFMFKRKKVNYGLRFDNCILHTFFCFQNLDLIMTDVDNKIICIYQNVKPNKIIPKNNKVKYIYEFSSNILNLNDINFK
ncbi:MAG: DUF192 domain-containing protein [Bacilli bacterium]|nr:DUF192 domain-containing protein [Bacilli bacterium]